MSVFFFFLNLETKGNAGLIWLAEVLRVAQCIFCADELSEDNSNYVFYWLSANTRMRADCTKPNCNDLTGTLCIYSVV